MRTPVTILIAMPALMIVSCGPAEPRGRWTKGDEAIEFLGDGKAVLTGKGTSIPMTYTVVEGGRVRLDSQQPLVGVSQTLVFDFNPAQHTLTMAQPDGSKIVFYEISGRIPKSLLGTWRIDRTDNFLKDSLLSSECRAGCSSNIVPFEVTFLPDGNGAVISFPETKQKPLTWGAWAWDDRLYRLQGSLPPIMARFKVRNDKLTVESTVNQTHSDGQRSDRVVTTFTRQK